MPALHAARAAQGTHDFPLDLPLIWILVVLASIFIFQTAAILSLLRLHNVRSKARWRRLRERGVVIVDGPTLIWRDDLPPPPTRSTMNLRQTLQIANR